MYIYFPDKRERERSWRTNSFCHSEKSSVRSHASLYQ